ncbi:hypothetical protein H2248_008697 [Termitomyces sp. 'cryptogamus']|nr:hypothetical protein H2248_008697 [Termitomyces sp. 'cryptogamus']
MRQEILCRGYLQLNPSLEQECMSKAMGSQGHLEPPSKKSGRKRKAIAGGEELEEDKRGKAKFEPERYCGESSNGEQPCNGEGEVQGGDERGDQDPVC